MVGGCITSEVSLSGDISKQQQHSATYNRFLLELLFFPSALSSAEDGWFVKVQPEVRGIEGYPVVLPCTFGHPQHSQHSSLQVVWRLGHGQGATVLYRCTSRSGAPTCEPGPKQDQRYRLEGNPREHDLSLRISNTILQDNGRYYCRVEVQGREHISFEDKMGTRLRVEGTTQITLPTADPETVQHLFFSSLV